MLRCDKILAFGQLAGPICLIHVSLGMLADFLNALVDKPNFPADEFVFVLQFFNSAQIENLVLLYSISADVSLVIQ